jgi:hypothetical protein
MMNQTKLRKSGRQAKLIKVAVAVLQFADSYKI